MANKTTWHRTILGIGALVAIALTGWLVHDQITPRRAAPRAALDLREGVLFHRGETEPYSGLLVEEWRPGVRRAEVTIRAGRADGRSRGWYENGQLEVEETFARGVSHGVRTRWYADGARKSQVSIRAGQMVGTFREWHPNGRLARETPLENGIGHGKVRAWDGEGRSLGAAIVNQGTLVRRE